MRLTPNQEKACLMAITIANAAIIALVLSSAGCLIPGGSCDTDPDCTPAVTSNDLEGTWCNQRSQQTCLTVIQPYSYSSDAPSTGTRYTLTIGLCTERGRLTGGLEFSPDTSSRVCLPGFTYGLWSARASFTSTGLFLTDIDQCQPAHSSNVCYADSFARADDLELYYVR